MGRTCRRYTRLGPQTPTRGEYELKMMKAGMLALGLLSGFALPAQAQMAWTDKGYAAIDFGGQFAAKGFDGQAVFPLYEEDATVQTSQDGKSAPMYDIRAGYKVWRNLAVGVGFSWASRSSDAALVATLPDPGVFDSPRTVNVDAPGLKHSESALHISGTWMIPVTDKIDVGLVGGPTVFFLSKEVASPLTVTEPGPVVTVDPTEESETGVGLHIGVDLQYMLNKRYGVGGLARYTWGKADVTGGEVTMGGFQLGGGLRVRF